MNPDTEIIEFDVGMDKMNITDEKGKEKLMDTDCNQTPLPSQPDKLVIIETEDDVKFELPVKIAKMSQTIFNVLENTDEDTPIPITIDSKIFKMVVDWCIYHEANPDPVLPKLPVHKKHPMVIPEFDQKLFDVNQETFKALKNAANYLHIDMLIRNLGRFVGIFAKDKSLKEIIDRFEPESCKNLSKEEWDKMEKDWNYCKDLQPDIDMDLHKYEEKKEQ